MEKKEMNKRDLNEKLNVPVDISAENVTRCPETVEEMINAYGTYNIQPTSDTENDFPAIAQGTPDYMAERSLEFFRDEDSVNPAKNESDKHCI